MHKSRAITRENKKKGRLEEGLRMRNDYGVYDPTPRQAVERMMRTSARKTCRNEAQPSSQV